MQRGTLVLIDLSEGRAPEQATVPGVCVQPGTYAYRYGGVSDVVETGDGPELMRPEFVVEDPKQLQESDAKDAEVARLSEAVRGLNGDLASQAARLRALTAPSMHKAVCPKCGASWKSPEPIVNTFCPACPTGHMTRGVLNSRPVTLSLRDQVTVLRAALLAGLAKCNEEMAPWPGSENDAPGDRELAAARIEAVILAHFTDVGMGLLEDDHA